MKNTIGETEYCLVRWLAKEGKQQECWVPAAGLTVSRKAHTLANVQKAASTDIDDEVASLATDCNTAKDKKTRRIKVAGVNILTYPCGQILAVDELYGSESLTQVLIPLFNLMCIPQMQDDVQVLVHDNACRLAAFIKNRNSDSEVLQKLMKIDMRCDRHHFRNHTGKLCRRLHNPDTCPELNNVNTSRMEQVNNDEENNGGGPKEGVKIPYPIRMINH